MKNSSYYIAPVGDWTHDLPHTVASNMVKVSHALNHSATEAISVKPFKALYMSTRRTCSFSHQFGFSAIHAQRLFNHIFLSLTLNYTAERTGASWRKCLSSETVGKGIWTHGPSIESPCSKYYRNYFCRKLNSFFQLPFHVFHCEMDFVYVKHTGLKPLG